jgi:hypothetical protein
MGRVAGGTKLASQREAPSWRVHRENFVAYGHELRRGLRMGSAHNKYTPLVAQEKAARRYATLRMKNVRVIYENEYFDFQARLRQRRHHQQIRSFKEKG